MSKVYKTLIFDDKVSLTLIDSTDIVNQAIKYHNLTPLTSAALGRTLTATLFMASNLKNEGDRLSVTVSGNGAGGHIIASADSDLNVRGYIDNPSVEFPLNEKGKLDVRKCVGTEGKITVVRTGIKEPYVGTSKIVSGELAEDFSYYYAVSEQEPTAMALGVLTSTKGVCLGAGGLIMQTLPFCDEETVKKAEELIMNFGDISKKMSELSAEGIIKEYFSEYKFYERNAQYKCICSKDYIDGVLITLGKTELENIIKEQGEVKVECHYCDKKYTYSEKDIEELFK